MSNGVGVRVHTFIVLAGWIYDVKREGVIGWDGLQIGALQSEIFLDVKCWIHIATGKL